MSFPKSPHLVEGSGRQVGIITLWTKKEHVLAHIPKELYVVGSQLYSRDEGISNLLRSLLEHKEVRDLVLTGADLNGCADALLALWSKGVKDGQVIGAPGYIDPEIPSQAVDRVREQVELHDKRDVPVRSLAEYIRSIPEKGSWGDPETYPEARLEPPEFFPYAQQHVLRYSSLEEAACALAYRQRRLGLLRNVQLQLTTPSAPPKQLQEVVVVPQDVVVREDEGFVSAHIGSCTLSQAVAFMHEHHKEGCCFTLTVDALGSDELTQELAPQTPSRRVTGDPAGNILVRLVPGEIQVTHLSPSGKRLEQFSSTSGEELYRKLVEEFRVADMSHAAYLGYELGKAEFALKNGEWYEQDLPLFFKETDAKPSSTSTSE